MLLSDITPYPKNAKEHPKKQIQQIANSIKEFGFNQPIVIDKNKVIIVGHGRYEAAKLLGLEDVPVIEANLSEEQAKSYRLADNKLNESDWDMDLVIQELKELSEQMIDLTGFSQSLLDDGFQYTSKIQTPIYEPSGKIPDISNLIDTVKYDALLTEINNLQGIKEDLKKFLLLSASRLIVFNYSRIADFYAHQKIEVKEIMEKMALVIIDYNKAIENGYVEAVNKILKLADD